MDRNSEWNLKADSNVRELSNEISSLKNGHWSNFRRDYKSFFRHAKEISNLFKSLKPIRQDERQELWDDFNSTCEQVSIERDEERRQRKADSKNERDTCMGLIREAKHAANGARGRNDIQDARNKFNHAVERLKENSKIMFRKDSQECWDEYKEGRNSLHYRIVELQDYDYSDAKTAVADARNAVKYKENPYDALDEVKAARARTKGLYLNREQVGYIRSDFDEIWESAIARIEEHKKEKQRKRENWLERQRDHIERWESRISKLEDVIDRLEGQIDDLEYKRSDARSDDFYNMVSGWISEKQSKISDIESTIRELHGKISDVRSKIGY